MNDSFLEDLDLVPKRNTPLPDEKFITTRQVLSQSTNLELKREKIISPSTNLPKNKLSSQNQESRKSESESKLRSSTPKSDKKKQCIDTIKQHDSAHRNTKKVRRSGSTECSSKCYEASKENSHPSTDGSSKESGIQSDSKNNLKQRRSDGLKKHSMENTDPVELLSAIKHLINKCGEQENLKLLRSMSEIRTDMQNLHINSQANLIKQMMHLQDNLVTELNVNKNTSNLKSLIAENEKLREDVFILKSRNEILQQKVNEIPGLKEEITSLKLKLRELQQ